MAGLLKPRFDNLQGEGLYSVQDCVKSDMHGWSPCYDSPCLPTNCGEEPFA
jgi:hypothetical protein